MLVQNKAIYYLWKNILLLFIYNEVSDPWAGGVAQHTGDKPVG